MAVSIISGVRTTDLVSASLIKREVYDAIFNFKPYQTPITQYFMANKLARLKVGNPKFELQEDVLMPHTTTLTANVAASGTEQTVTCTTGEGYYFKVGDIIRITETGENARISTYTTNGNNLLFTALDNSTALTATTSGASGVIRIGSAYAEGTAAATALTTVSTFPYSYTQIMKQTVDMSGTQAATVNYGGNDFVNQRIKATEEFKLQMERNAIYGIRNIRTTAGGYIRFTSGLLDSSGAGISDSSQFVGNDFCTEDDFFKTYCKSLFAKGTNRKKLYCGSDALLAINDYSKVKQKTQVSEKEYGVDVTSILTPFGMADLIWHPLLEGAYSNWVIGVDRDEYFKYAFLGNEKKVRDMQYEDNIQVPGTDETKAQYLAEVGYWIAGGSQGVHRILKPGASA